MRASLDNISIFITGSNSKLLSEELSSVLSGRYAAMALENVVYNELLTRGYEVYVGKTTKGEVDFIANKDNKIKYIQVAYLLSDENVLERIWCVFIY